MYPFASDLFLSILYSGVISDTQQYCIPRGPKLHSVLPSPHFLISPSEDRVWSHLCSALVGTRFGECVFVFESMSPFSWAHSRREMTTREMVILLFIVRSFHSNQSSTHSTFPPVGSLPFLGKRSLSLCTEVSRCSFHLPDNGQCSPVLAAHLLVF